jgi:hypothetical protein
LFAVGALLFSTAHRLPAPISEIPTPTPAQSVEPKTKPPSNSKKKSSTAKKTATMADQEVRVLISENTQAALKYLRDYVENFEKMPFAWKSDVKPDEILPRLQQVLSARFRNVSIGNGVSAGRHNKTGLVMVFDLQAHVGSWSGTTNTVSLTGTFKDSNGKTLETVSALGKSTVPYPASHTSFPKAVAAAFAEFSQKLGVGSAASTALKR